MHLHLLDDPVVWLGGAVTDAHTGPGQPSYPRTQPALANSGFVDSIGATLDGSTLGTDVADFQQARQMMNPQYVGCTPEDPCRAMNTWNQNAGATNSSVAVEGIHSHENDSIYEYVDYDMDLSQGTGLTAGTVLPGPILRGRLSDQQNQPAQLAYSTNNDIAANISFRVETKRVYICTYIGCNKKYSRMPDLRRHYRGSHLDDRRFRCRALGCERAIHGFPRRDKRDVHEKKMHIDIGDGILL
ncbi:hypothetical protein J4E91_004896 [Alternaria rosae]|nr:hypothetical protein J4E91_004896 [Alternaria rosae]